MTLVTCRTMLVLVCPLECGINGSCGLNVIGTSGQVTQAATELHFVSFSKPVVPDVFDFISVVVDDDWGIVAGGIVEEEPNIGTEACAKLSLLWLFTLSFKTFETFKMFELYKFTVFEIFITFGGFIAFNCGKFGSKLLINFENSSLYFLLSESVSNWLRWKFT